jgi:glucosamine-phosphate N-acetyltransferase
MVSLSDIRELDDADVHRGYFDLLRQLTVAPDVAPEEFSLQLRRIRETAMIHIVCIDDLDRGAVVACGTIVLEPKLSRGCSWVGHIEDIVVHKDYQGMGLGKRIISHLVAMGRRRGCYKLILDADPRNAGFYEKCGFRKNEVQFRMDL